MNLKAGPEAGDDPLILDGDVIDRLRKERAVWVSVMNADGKETLEGIMMDTEVYEQFWHKASEFERVRMVAELIKEEVKREPPYRGTKMGFGF